MDEQKGFFGLLDKYLMGPMGYIAQFKIVRAITAAGMAAVPFTIVGSAFLVLSIIPQAFSFWPVVADVFAASFDKFTALYMVANYATMGSLSLYFVLSMAYELTKIYADEEDLNLNPLNGALLALFAFIMTVPQIVFKGGAMSAVVSLKKDSVVADGWAMANGVTRFGTTGIFTAIIMAIVTVLLYRMCVKHNWVIKMPESVPEGVSRGFTALIPGFVVAFVVIVINGILVALGTDIFNVIAIPFGFVSNLTGTWIGIMIIYLLTQALWIVGIHGANIIFAFVNPIAIANMALNAKGAHYIVAGEFSNMFVIAGGSGLIALVYDFILNSLGWWEEVIRTTAFKWGTALADQTKLNAAVDTDAALLGLGYFTGLRYAAIIAAGSFFSWFVCIPIVYYLAPEHIMQINGHAVPLAEAPIRKVFLDYVRHIGIGMLAMAGIIGLLNMSKVVASVVKNAVLDIFSSKTVDVNLLRTQRDVPTSWIGAGILLCTVLFAAYFHFMYAESLSQTIVAFLIVLIMSFLLSVVGISSIAYTGTEPVSGMTIFMIIISAVCLTAAGMTGKVGMIAVLMMASFIGTTIGMAGNFMSELKVAHMTGATPKKMEQWQIVGTILCAVLSVGVMILLNDAYGFVGDHALNAPQANAMAAIIEPMMTGGSAQWPLYMAGALFAIILWMVKVPPLAFALGTYLPMEINTPLLIGGLIAYFVQNSTKDKELADLRFSKGSTIASGLVAGGAIGSLFSAVLRIAGVDVFAQDWVETPEATYLSIVMYLLLCVFLYKVAMYVKAKKAK